VLNAQNGARNAVGVSDFAWSSTLAANAQQWANKCVFEDTSIYGTGSNVAMIIGYLSTPEDLIHAFINQKPYYNGGVGCAYNFCSINSPFPTYSNGQWTFLVCFYSSTGNIVG
jgi:hypothetical protein